MSEVVKNGDDFRIVPGQDLIASVGNELRIELNSLVKESPKKIVIDLSGVKTVDSVGIGVLIATHNSMKKIGGKIKISNLNDDIYELFCAMRLNQHFEIVKAK